MRFIGQNSKRLDATAKVTGEAIFPGDLSMDGMAHMKVLFAGRPHARIRSLDTSHAEALPGVLAVLTAKDVPINNFGIDIFDQPVLCEDVVRSVGDRVALVIAESEPIAAKGVALIDVVYEDLPILASPEAALEPGAPVLHPDQESNVLDTFRIRKGDIEAGFAKADVIIEETYTMGAQEHVYMQPDAGLAWVDENGKVIVKTAGQWAHDDRRLIAHCLDLPEDRVQVIYTYIGGAFGGREDVSVQIILGLATFKLGRPVKVIWNREETTIGHPKRHPMKIYHKWGATRDGKLVAQQTKILADAGAYASTTSWVVSSTVLLSTGPYEVENVWLDGQAVFTNNILSGAFRGFGIPQAVFAAELQIARLAEALGMDPVELRMRNLVREGSLTGTMMEVMPNCSTRETLEAAAKAAGWVKTSEVWKRHQTHQEVRPGTLHGVGIASGWKNIGYTLGFQETSTATIELYGEAEIERVVVRLPAAEVGQGIQTTITQMVSEAFGVSSKQIELLMPDTDEAESAGSVSASRMALMAGNVLRGAAEAVLEKWKDEERPAIATHTYHAPLTEPMDPETGAATGAFALAYVAQAVEVEVDIETGHVKVTRIISANDVGRAINPKIVEGQIEGAAIQGMGWALMEDFVTKNGEVLTPGLSTYLIPTVLDVPEDFQSLILEENLPLGPWGVNGMGEMPLISIAPAILDAVHDATGVWHSHIPLTPERLLTGMDQ
jgi:CO/xanthine dehydrogenase Mo-binding subunit